MPQLRYYNPTNPKQQYQTSSAADPNIPAGWLDTQGSDGAIPAALQVFVAGINNQGAGGPSVSNGDPNEITATGGVWPNGVINGYQGGKATG